MAGLIEGEEQIPVAGVSSDLRTWAAMTLAEYRDIRGSDAVASLYFRTGEVTIRRYAAELGARQIIPEILASMKERVWKNHLEELGIVGAVEAKPEIGRIFANSGESVGMRVAAAGAMIRLGEQEPYFEFLADIVTRSAMMKNSADSEDLDIEGAIAIRDLGAVRNDRVEMTLEQVLSSRNKRLTEIALIQLRVNYPSSQAARRLLLESLAETNRLDALTVFRLAAMTNDSQIRDSAAQRNKMLWQRVSSHATPLNRHEGVRASGEDGVSL